VLFGKCACIVIGLARKDEQIGCSTESPLAQLHVMQHANAAVDEVRRAEFFRKGGRMRDLVKGKRWLLLSRWVHLNTAKKNQLNTLFHLNLASDESLPTQGKPGPNVDLHLRRGDVAVLAKLDRPASVAAVTTVPKVS
jgi:hypothetical protein